MSRWVKWDGNDPLPPVDEDCRVQVKFRGSSRVNDGPVRAGNLRWTHQCDGNDIVAYRIVKPQPNCLGCEQAVCDTCEPVKRDQPAQIHAALDALKPSTNPKDAIGSFKLPLHLWPAEATAMGCLGMLEGACKYGRNNYVAGDGVIASIYVDAAKRHLDAWFSGEEFNPDLTFNDGEEPVIGVSHLANALACLAIIVKAQANGKLIDDRDFAPTNGYRKLVERITPLVKKIKQKFSDKSPKHYTIADNPKEGQS